MTRTRLWMLVKRCIAVLMFTIYGFVTGGAIGGSVTLMAYGIGSWVSAPIGAGWAASIGYRTPLRDACLLFYGLISGIWIGVRYANHVGWGDLAVFGFSILCGVLCGALLYVGGRELLAPRLRFALAVVLLSAWSLVWLYHIYFWLYVSDA